MVLKKSRNVAYEKEYRKYEVVCNVMFSETTEVTMMRTSYNQAKQNIITHRFYVTPG